MVKSLRKRHRQVWSLLLLLLPAGIIFSWLAIPGQAPVKLLQSSPATLLPLIVQTQDLPAYKITVRSNATQTEWQLEWKNKRVLTVPSAVIYQLSDTTTDVTKAQLIGRIEATGTYVFPLIKESMTGSPRFVLYDFIHEQIIDQINFQP